MHPFQMNISSGLILALCLATACEGEKGTSNGDLARSAQAAPPIIAPLATPYREVPVVAGGAISGTITVDGAMPAPRDLRVTSDEAVCGEAVDESLVSTGGGLPDAVVWLEGVAAGKPRARLRRYEVNQMRCALEPRLQAVEAGGAINVHSHDPITHRTRFIAQPAGSVLSVVREVDAGQVVPDEKSTARAGLVEIRCEQHPWTQGWLAVFDHPYFAVTGADGTFLLEDVPPGTYTLVVWHERGERSTQRVTVAAGQRCVQTSARNSLTYAALKATVYGTRHVGSRIPVIAAKRLKTSRIDRFSLPRM